MYESMLPSTKKGKEFASYVKKDKSIIDLPNPPVKGVKKAISNLEKLLSRKQFSKIQAEYETLGKSVNWYHLFGGPKNIQSLAYHLERHVQYEFLYRQWSSVAHAHDFSEFLAVSSTGDAEIQGIRNPELIVRVSRFASTFMIDATRMMIKKIRPGEDFSRYYLKEIQEPYNKLSSL